jgi:hypothetical protein
MKVIIYNNVTTEKFLDIETDACDKELSGLISQIILLTLAIPLLIVPTEASSEDFSRRCVSYGLKGSELRL